MEELLQDDIAVTNPHLTDPHIAVLQFIKQTFDSILSEIQIRPFGAPKVVLQRITSLTPRLDASNRVEWIIGRREITYSWPGKNQDEAWRFTCIGRILFNIYAAIMAGVVLSKREIFYQDPKLFKNQEMVDKYIDDIAFTCGVSRKDLNVTASPRGLVTGLRNGIDTILNSSDAIGRLDLKHANWILVVEKEATFKYLTECRFQHRFDGGIIVTGKGYPDLATKQFLRTLVDLLNIDTHIYGLFDADPDGIDIFRCYSTGSKGLAQELSIGLPELKWLGVDIMTVSGDACISMSSRDRMKAQSMLERSELTWTNKNSLGVRACLQQMLMLNRKAEIQAQGNLPDTIAQWIEKTMC